MGDAKANKSRVDEKDARRKGPARVHSLSVKKKILFTLATTSGFFLLIEMTLALVGVAPRLYDRDPYVGFAANVPLFIDDGNPAGATHMVTAPNKLAWFNLQRFPKVKRPGTYRIFCLGGSTTYGRPYDDRASFSGWLRELLPVADPAKKWEVINAGGISYASYRVALVMEELARYEPDLFIIYSGHNEFLERRTYPRLVEAPRVLRELGGLIGRTRLYAAGEQFVQALSPRPAVQTGTVLGEEVDTILDRSVGPDEYTRDDKLRDQVIGHYRFNMDRMIDIARSAGADIVLVTPAANLKDSSPFKSEHRSGLDVADLERFNRLDSEARAASAAGQLDQALAALDKAVAIDDRHAEIQYQRGRLLFDLGRYKESKAALQRAIEEDICSLRAPRPFREVLAEVASQRDVSLLDFAQSMEDRSQHGIPGAEHFVDHVHLTVGGYRLLALQLVDALERKRILSKGAAWNPSAIATVTETVESSLDRKAHGIAMRNLAKVFSWAGKLEEAERMAGRALELIGDDAESLNILGLASKERGDVLSAVGYYRRAVQLDPNHARAHNNLGNVLSALGYYDDSILHYRRALDIEQGYAKGHFNLANALWAAGDSEQAVAHYRHALEINPDYAEAHNNLGWALRQEGSLEAALEHLQHAVRLKPDAAPLTGMAWILATHPSEEIRDASQSITLAERAAELVDHADPMTLDALAAAYAAGGRFEQAAKTAREAIELAAASQDFGLADQIRNRLELYSRAQPYRESARGETVQ